MAHRRKLKKIDVQQIKETRSVYKALEEEHRKYRDQAIAKLYGVCPNTVWRLSHGHTTSTLTPDQIEEVRGLIAGRRALEATMQKMTFPAIAKRYGVSPSTIYYAATGRFYAK